MKRTIIYTAFSVIALLLVTKGYTQDKLWHNNAAQTDKFAKQMVAQMKIGMSRANSSKGTGADGLIRSKEQYDTIALVTFSVNGHEAYSRQMATGNKAWAWVTLEGAKYYANRFYKQCIQQMKADFKARGVVLLTPDEFLDTPEKQQLYKSFKVEVGGLNKLVGKGAGLGKLKSRAAADGFSYIDFNNMSIPSFANSVGGELAKGLGVKMVLGITLTIIPTTPKSTDNMKMTKVSWQVLGLNAFPKTDGMKEGGFRGYNEGNVYAERYITFGKKVGEGAPFQYKKKGEKIEIYDGFEKVMGMFIKGTLDGFEEAVKKYGTR